MSDTKRRSDALRKLSTHLASLGTEPPVALHEVREKVAAIFGSLPLFPDQFVYVVNYTSGEVIHANGFERVLGYPDALVDLALIHQIWHPDDAPLLAVITERATRALMTILPALQPFESTLTVDYRVRKSNGEYIKVQRQSTVFETGGDPERAISSCSYCRDISNLKTHDRMGWQWLGRGSETISFTDMRDQMNYLPTAREMDVLRKLADGRSSKEIAVAFGLSVFTVNTHRRNLLERTGLSNTAELVGHAGRCGWV